MRKKALFYSVALICLVSAAALVPQAKAAYPEKPIEMVVHSSPGGGSDLFTRTVAHILEKEGLVKQKIRVVNRRGGGGTVALNYLASKKGDPYVLMQVTTSPLSAILRGSSRMKFEDITLIAKVVEDPNLAFTRYGSSFKDMKSLIAEAKKAPKKISVSFGNVGGSEHICAHRVSKAAGVVLNMVSFKSGAGAATALLGGHVDFSFGNVNEQMGQIEAKKIRPLAAITEKRIPYLPDVPTMREQGIDAVFSQLRGFWAPQNFPPYALKFWEETFARLTETKGFKDYLQTTYGVKSFIKHEEFRTFLVEYLDDLRQDVIELGVYKKKK
ncbi:MAG: tripartite tricarboxylate transporter substrate binding protein [Deltaproteobacteria bacterium]|nr:tripartite tricarboxylate transporter substrate binding protein [Deltaproteobacteria bacterium]MBW2306490.1 tripartite tricarboxylate transporter substrate binding protein [Deltaproteobacteria bacterium]